MKKPTDLAKTQNKSKQTHVMGNTAGKCTLTLCDLIFPVLFGIGAFQLFNHYIEHSKKLSGNTKVIFFWFLVAASLLYIVLATCLCKEKGPKANTYVVL